MRLNEFSEEYVLSLARKGYEEGSATFEVVPEKCTLLVAGLSHPVST